MATNENKKPTSTPIVPASTEKATAGNDARHDKGKDPDLYDPVGMAGQKAGIVKEIQEESAEPGTTKGKDANPDARSDA